MEQLGIDLSKLYFDATLLKGCGEQVYRRFDNEANGLAQLGKWLVRQGVRDLHACMEATNIAALIKTRTQQKNRLADCLDEDVRHSLQLVLTTLEAEIERMQQHIVDFIQQDPDLSHQKRLLLSIKGFGKNR